MAITNFTGHAELADSSPAENIAQRVIATAYARPVMDNICGAFGPGYGHDFISDGRVRSYARLDKLAAAALTTGTDAIVTALGDSQVSITLAECGVGVAYGDTLDVASGPTMRNRVADLMAKAYADYIDTVLLALSSSLTDSVGGAAAMSDDVFLQAIHELEENEADGPYAAVLYTTQVHELRVGAATSMAPVYAREGILSRIGPALPSAFAFNLYEVDVFKSTNVPVYNTTRNLGMMFPMNAEQFPLMRLIGVPKEGPWSGQAWDGRYAEERDESGRLTERWITGYWNAGVIAPNYGVGLDSNT